MAVRWYNKWYVYALVAVVTVLAIEPVLEWAIPVKTYYLPSVSMEPTIQAGERVLAAKDYYGDHLPARGDIAVHVRREDRGLAMAVARIVGLPGETVTIRNKTLFIDEVKLDDPWGAFRDQTVYSSQTSFPAEARKRDNFGPFVIPQDSYFLLGDNRDFSYDSRFVGLVHRNALRDKVLYIYWSRDLGRIGTRLQ